MNYKSIAAACLAGLFLTSGTLQATAAEPLADVKQYVNDYYYPGISKAEVNKSTSIKQLMKKLDDYSSYMTPAEFNEFYNAVENQLVGIGVGIVEHKKGIKILQVYDGSPAKKAGMKASDIITAVNGKSIAGLSIEESSNRLKGDEGTSVTVKFYRPSTGKSYTRKMTRALVNLPNVETSVLAGHIAYIRLNSFSEDSGAAVAKAIRNMPASTQGYIFDLRDNGGGDVEAAEKIIGLAKKNKIAYLLKTREGNYKVQPAKMTTHFDKSVAMLVNGNSASASEMTAASYKDQKAATIYGQKTYGKGVMQSIVQVKNKGYLKLTIAEFRGPKNAVIQNKGVTPNVVTPKNKELYTSHQAFLKKQLKKFDKEATIKRTATNPKMTVKPTKDMDWKTLKTAKVSLLQIGGKEKDVTVKLKGKSLVVTPKTKLKAGTNYYLRVKNAKDSTDGTYRYVMMK